VNRRALAAALAGLVVLGACSISAEGSARKVPAGDVPFQLVQTTTTQIDATTTTAVAVAEIDVFLVRDGRLAAVARKASGPTADSVLSLLALGPTDVESASGLRTALVPDLAALVDVGQGLVVIDLAAEFTELTPTEARLALAQITYSLTQLAGIERVRFLVAGQDASVPRGDGSATDQPVTPADYVQLAPR
jgi:spore germination protein GerM